MESGEWRFILLRMICAAWGLFDQSGMPPVRVESGEWRVESGDSSLPGYDFSLLGLPRLEWRVESGDLFYF